MGPLGARAQLIDVALKECVHRDEFVVSQACSAIMCAGIIWHGLCEKQKMNDVRRCRPTKPQPPPPPRAAAASYTPPPPQRSHQFRSQGWMRPVGAPCPSRLATRPPEAVFNRTSRLQALSILLIDYMHCVHGRISCPDPCHASGALRIRSSPPRIPPSYGDQAMRAVLSCCCRLSLHVPATLPLAAASFRRPAAQPWSRVPAASPHRVVGARVVACRH